MCRNRCDGLLLKSLDIGSEDWYLQPPSKASFTINFDNNILLYQYSVHLYRHDRISCTCIYHKFKIHVAWDAQGPVRRLKMLYYFTPTVFSPGTEMISGFPYSKNSLLKKEIFNCITNIAFIVTSSHFYFQKKEVREGKKKEKCSPKLR